MPAKAVKSDEIPVLSITSDACTVGIIGTSPLIFNRMAEKARRELLLPRGRKTDADKRANLKHVPIEEYRASVYRNAGNTPKTRLCFPAPGFKGAMATAALDLPGTKKSEIGRLAWVEGTHVDIYGTPQLLMSVVRSADINKTPDIRTRAIVPEWACEVTVRFVRPKLQRVSVANLLTAAGITAGIGDFRQEKGKGSFGQFRVLMPDDPEFKRVMKTLGARKEQDAALENPVCFDAESEELLGWYADEVVKMRDSGVLRRRAHNDDSEEEQDVA